MIPEREREALMRLTMCAREEGDMCKYKDTCNFDFQYETATRCMNILADALRKDESLTEGVWNAGYKTGYDKGYKDAQKVKDSQDLVKDLVKAFGEDGTWLERQGVYTLTLAEAKQRAVDIIESVLAKDEPTTQTGTQNSNLTFKKRTMRDCYNCKRYETEDECIECHYEPKDEPQTCDTCKHNCTKHTYDHSCEVCADMDNYEPQTDCAWK